MSDAKPWVIVLNGVGSVGKSSTARALQAIAARPFLHVSMDAFVGMLPERMLGHPDGMMFETGFADGHPSIHVKTGPVMAQAMRGMRHAIAALARQGNDLIVDDVMFDPMEAAEYRALLVHATLRFVGLFAPLEVMEVRELARGDRVIGLARGQIDRVHRGTTYDLEIDAARHDAEDEGRDHLRGLRIGDFVIEAAVRGGVSPMLIVFGGLPGTGKTTIARRMASQCRAVYLRVDVIEQAMREAGIPAGDVGAAGYAVADAIAEANLVDGRMVVADCVNPVAESREAWRAVASRSRVRLMEVEIICTDLSEHRRRVEGRISDLPGLVLPCWRDVQEHAYEAWDEPHVVVDTASLSPEQATATVCLRLQEN